MSGWVQPDILLFVEDGQCLAFYVFADFFRVFMFCVSPKDPCRSFKILSEYRGFAHRWTASLVQGHGDVTVGARVKTCFTIMEGNIHEKNL